jgi:hypothetical protein
LNGTTGALTGTPNATGTFTGVVTATNSGGTATQNFSITIAATVPGAPTIGTATPGNGVATISFTAPASNGGSAITSFVATCNPGAVTTPNATSPITVGPLTNGTTYTCSVQAVNSVGASAASATVSVTPGVGPAITSGAPPAGTFGVAYSHTYTASGSPAPTFSLTSGAFPGGLSLNGSTGALTGTPNAAGTFTGVVTATNSSGSTTQAFSITIGPALPGAPTIGTATPGNAQATIAFTAPASNGGSAITSFTATCLPGPFSASGAASPITVTGLTNGTSYSCSVTATNGVGTGPASSSVSVTAGVVPAFTSGPPPAGTFNVAYSHTFTASGAPAPTFSLTSGTLPGGLALAPSGAVTGTPTTAGTFSGVVTATNSAGSATQSFSITIAGTVPGAPTIGSATPGNAIATISFTPPASNGGSPITGYTASCTPGPKTGSNTASPITVTGLTNGTTYTCSVKATNAIGTSASSGTVTVTPLSGIVLALVDVVSRKVHPGWGAFDLPVNAQAIGGAITVEPRMIGAGHKLVFSFNDAVFSVGSVACVDASSNPVGTATAVIVGNTVEVTLTGVPDRMRVSVSLGGLNGTLNASRAVGFLVGDVDNSYTVDSKDILKIKGSSKAGPITSQNFIYDVDVSGGVSLSDQNAAKVNTGISI